MHHVLFGTITLAAVIIIMAILRILLPIGKKITFPALLMITTILLETFILSIFFLPTAMPDSTFDQIVIEEEQISEKQFSLCAFPTDDEVYMVIDGGKQIFCYEDDGLLSSMELNPADTDLKFGEQPSIKVFTSVKRYKHQWKFLYYNSTEIKKIYEVEIPKNSIAFEIPTS